LPCSGRSSVTERASCAAETRTGPADIKGVDTVYRKILNIGNALSQLAHPASSLVSRGGHAGPPVSTRPRPSRGAGGPQLREAIVESPARAGPPAVGGRDRRAVRGQPHAGARRLRAARARGVVVTVARAGAYVAAIDQRLGATRSTETREAIETPGCPARRAPARRGRRGSLPRALLAHRGAREHRRAHLHRRARPLSTTCCSISPQTTTALVVRSVSGRSDACAASRCVNPAEAASLDHARAIVAAIARRDEDAAERAMRAQLTTARAAVTAVLSR